MADRDVTVDILARDKTGPAVQSTTRNLKEVDGQAKKTAAAAKAITDQWSRGLSRVAGAAGRWANSGDTAGKRFARGIASGVGAVSKIGGQIGEGLSKAVAAAGPYVQVAVAGVLASAALAVAPALGGAIVGGAGLGGVVGGLLVAAKDARVAAAFGDLKETAGSQLQDAAKRFVPATLDAVNRAKAIFAGMVPDLRQLFDVSATWLGPLTERIGRGAQAALSGITAAVSKAGPIIKVIGEGVENVLRGVGDGFRMLSDNGASMALALKGVFFIVEVAVRGVFFVLNVLIEAFEKVASVVPGLKGKLEELRTGQDGAKVSAFNLSGGFQALAGDANAAAAGITRVKEKADEFVENNLSLRDAQIQAGNAIKETTAAINANAGAHGLNTQKGRQNEAALNALAGAFNREADAGDKSGLSAGKASDAYHRNRAALVSMAEKAGYSRQKAQELAAQLLKVPKNVHTDINANTGAAKAAVDSFQKKINGLKGKTVNVTVRITSKGDHYIPGVGTQLKNAAGSAWGEAAGGTTARTGGPTKVEVTSAVQVMLDGQPFYGYVTRAVDESERRQEWRSRVGKR
ncbi:hypothetical protein [Nakamurella sp.]|uniref:hypothetical protein n=1 Tax=Nakamurella sp. TaxID=1869182 RepID=UPI003B3A9A9F